MSEEEKRNAMDALLSLCVAIVLRRITQPDMDNVSIIMRGEAEEIIRKLICREQEKEILPTKETDYDRRRES